MEDKNRDLIELINQACAHRSKLAPTEDERIETIRKLRVPEEFAWATYDNERVVALCKRHELKPFYGPWLNVSLFAGPAGLGKTTLATAMYQRYAELAEIAYPVWFAASRLAFHALRESKLGVISEKLASARQSKLLLLDDLGQEEQTPTSRALIEDLISERHREHRMTIVTTGLTSVAIGERYGAGVKRRLTEKGRANVFVLKGGAT